MLYWNISNSTYFQALILEGGGDFWNNFLFISTLKSYVSLKTCKQIHFIVFFAQYLYDGKEKLHLFNV